MRKVSRFLALSAAILMCGLSTIAKGGALDDRVPKDAMLYAGWAGGDALQAQYAQSNLKNILAASVMEKFVTETVATFLERESARNPQAKRDIDRAKLGLSIAWKHPVAFYFCPLDFTDPRMPGFRMGLMCDAGTDAKPLADLLNELLTENPPPRELPIKVVQDGNVVILQMGKVETAAEMRADGGLAALPAYKAAMEQAKVATPALSVYGDVTKAVAMLNDALVKLQAPPEAREKIPLVLDAMGVNSMTQIAMNSGFEGKGWVDRTFLGINGPKKGFLTLIDGPALSDAILAAVPRDSSMFSAFKLDLNRAFTETRAVIEKADTRALQEFDRGVAAGSREIGVDIPKEILAAISDEWVFYRGPIDEVEGSTFAGVVKLKDGPTLAKSLATLEKLFNTSPIPFKVEKVTTGRVEVSTIAITTFSIAWTVRNDNLYISTLAGIAGAVKQVENKSPSIIENDLYKQARAAFPADVKPIAISYAHPAKLYPELRRLALGILPLIRQAGVTVPMEILPDAADVAQFMTPGASLAWVDNAGLHVRGNYAFPGAQLLGGQQVAPALVGVGAVGAAVALPAMARSQQAGGIAVDASNLRGIAQSSLVYASDRRDELPDSLARLVADGMISPRQLISRRSGTQPFEMTPETARLAKEDFAKFSEMVEARCDYVYLGKGTKSDIDASVIIAYEKPGKHTPDGLNLAFKDGHVEFASWGSIEQMFNSTNEYLKKNSKPVIDVKALMVAAGRSPGLP